VSRRGQRLRVGRLNVDPLAIITVLSGTISTLVAVIVFGARMHLSGDDKREAERDRREAQLIAERDAWQHRWEASDGRLERVSNAFVAAFKRPAPE